MSKRSLELTHHPAIGCSNTDAKKQREEDFSFEWTYLRSIPCATQYEKSFMHKEAITHVLAMKTNFMISASIDGVLKFWKRMHGEGVEFVKSFRCYFQSFSCITANHDGTLLATVSLSDKIVKVFDVINFDMINMIELNFQPKLAAWIHQGSDVIPSIAITDLISSNICIYDGKGDDHCLHILRHIHSQPVKLIQYNSVYDCIVSVDNAGIIEYWSGSKSQFRFPNNVQWEYKTDTDLYEFIKVKAVPHFLTISPNCRLFATFGSDRIIRVFYFLSGKLLCAIDETLSMYVENAKQNKNYGLQIMEWSRRVALEKELDRDDSAFQHVSICFDESSNFILYSTLVGVKVFNVNSEKVVREIGRTENMRFLGLSLCPSVPDVNDRYQGSAVTVAMIASDNPNLKRVEADPMIIAFAVRRNRFYLFTNAEPFSTDVEDSEGVGMNRDVFNEKPRKEDILMAIESETAESKMNECAVIHTTFGDVHIRLHANECPKTVENFCTLARRGYYNGHTFHRVIRSFMIQTGDPTGKGTGGQSIWGHDFEDEFHPRLRHDKPYMVSMANAGPNTNGSQFFITVVPAEWLDGKNTLFGQVTEGFNVVQKINQVSTYEKSGRPKQEISIVSITLK